MEKGTGIPVPFLFWAIDCGDAAASENKIDNPNDHQDRKRDNQQHDTPYRSQHRLNPSLFPE